MEVIRRDDCDFELTFKDVDGNVINLTGSTVFFTVKRHVDDDDDDAVISKTITSFEDPTSGVALLQLSKTDTDLPAKAYYFDVQLVDSGGKVSSSQAGRFIVSQDITVRTIDNGS